MFVFVVCMAMLATGSGDASSAVPSEDTDCMTQLIDLAGILPGNRNDTITIFRDQALDQRLVHHASGFDEVNSLLQHAGVGSLRDRFSLFTCLKKASATSTSPCHSKSPCGRGGVCAFEEDRFQCIYSPGYTGSDCKKDLDEYATPPGQPGNSFTGQCPQGCDGRDCENSWLTRSAWDVFQKSQEELQASLEKTQTSLEGTQASLEVMQSSLQETKTNVASLAFSGSSAYTRWGRTTCPDSATIVYNGYVAGPHYTHIGGPSNLLCLHESPKYARFADYRWGAVYHGAVYKMQNLNAPYPSHLDSKLAPCVVCAAKRKSTTVMIPARNDCPTGWSLEYHGYLLASNFDGNRKGQSLCFDDAIEGHTPSGDGGHHLYRVGVFEGFGLPSHFLNAREMTCAVCSK